METDVKTCLTLTSYLFCFSVFLLWYDHIYFFSHSKAGRTTIDDVTN